jgi:hypothetical protein
MLLRHRSLITHIYSDYADISKQIFDRYFIEVEYYFSKCRYHSIFLCV